MKIIEWNCRYGDFQGKKTAILEHKPDILVVPECENIVSLTFHNGTQPSAMEWVGDSVNRYGIGVFGFNGYCFEKLGSCDHVKYFGAFRAFRGETSLTLLVAWANKTGSSEKYHEIVEEAIKHYDQLLQKDKVLFIGDFNTPGTGNNLDNPKIDKPNSYLKKHLEIVETLKNKGLESVYHCKNEEEHGHETTATLFYCGCQEGRFHCDYCFASKDMREALTGSEPVKIGEFDVWKKDSDHMPLIVDFNL